MSSSVKALEPAFQGAGQRMYPKWNCTSWLNWSFNNLSDSIYLMKYENAHMLQWDGFCMFVFLIPFCGKYLFCRTIPFLFELNIRYRGTEIWRIENFQPVPLPKSDYGKFYSGDSYIVLQVRMTFNVSVSFILLSCLICTNWLFYNWRQNLDFLSGFNIGSTEVIGINSLLFSIYTFRHHLAREVHIYMIYISGLERILARYYLPYISFHWVINISYMKSNCHSETLV